MGVFSFLEINLSRSRFVLIGVFLTVLQAWLLLDAMWNEKWIRGAVNVVGIYFSVDTIRRNK